MDVFGDPARIDDRIQPRNCDGRTLSEDKEIDTGEGKAERSDLSDHDQE
jgi:hypothetical protein